MYFIHAEPVTQEQILFVEENEIPTVQYWVNINQAHNITIVEVGFNFWVKATFSEGESYYLAYFDCEKAAKKYVRDLIDH